MTIPISGYFTSFSSVQIDDITIDLTQPVIVKFRQFLLVLITLAFIFAGYKISQV